MPETLAETTMEPQLSLLLHDAFEGAHEKLRSDEALAACRASSQMPSPMDNMSESAIASVVYREDTASKEHDPWQLRSQLILVTKSAKQN